MVVAKKLRECLEGKIAIILRGAGWPASLDDWFDGWFWTIYRNSASSPAAARLRRGTGFFKDAAPTRSMFLAGTP